MSLQVLIVLGWVVFDKKKVAKNVITGCILFAKILQMPQKRTKKGLDHNKRSKDMRHTITGKRKAGMN